MLRLRIISALIAAPLVLAAIFYLPLAIFAVVFLAAASLALWEWGRLAGLTGARTIAAYLLVYWLLAALLWLFPVLVPYLLSVAILFWGWACILVYRFPAGSGRLRDHRTSAVIGQLVFLSAWQSLVSVRALHNGDWLLVWIFVLVWAADIGGYFAGKTWGRSQLAASVSPGKTWQGVWGGSVLAVAITLAMAGLLPPFQVFDRSIWLWLALAVLLIALSIMGDLFESLLKRVRGVKDSGAIMPGHGGLLDRVDALIAVLPLFALTVTCWNH